MNESDFVQILTEREREREVCNVCWTKNMERVGSFKYVLPESRTDHYRLFKVNILKSN